MVAVASLDGARREHARRVAHALLQRFGVQSKEHIHIEGFAARLRVKVSMATFVGATAQLLAPRDGPAEIVLSDRVRDPAVQRFNIAHELGHYMLRHPSPSFAEMCAPLVGGHDLARECLEGEANAFALEVLMPEPLVRPTCDVPWASLSPALQIAPMFGVSAPAAAIRFVGLTSIPCAAVLSERRAVRWAEPSSAFPWSVTPGRPLDRRSIAWGYFERSASCTETRLVPAAAWLDSSSEMPLIEDSVATQDGEGVLTMLSVPTSAWMRREAPGSESSVVFEPRSPRE